MYRVGFVNPILYVVSCKRGTALLAVPRKLFCFNDPGTLEFYMQGQDLPSLFGDGVQLLCKLLFQLLVPGDAQQGGTCTAETECRAGGAGPTLLCITRNPGLEGKLSKKIHDITEANWELIPLHVEFQGARVIAYE